MASRTHTQLIFDRAKHGWAFCDSKMLTHRILRCETISMSLAPNDKRQDELRAMKKALKEMERPNE